MSLHIKANQGEIAETVLMPGDPLRAKYIATHFLENVYCYNQVRNMLGYTGEYQGKKISIQSSGMGVPSFLIYAEELIREYGCKYLIRIGTCGSIQQTVQLGNLLIVQAAHTDSNAIQKWFPNAIFAPTADWQLMDLAIRTATKKQQEYQVGTVFTADLFYDDNKYDIWQKFGTLAVEMETAGLYTVAAKHGVKALSLLTVSDEILTGKNLSHQEREQKLNSMFEIALEVASEIG